MVSNEARRLPLGATLVVVTGYLTPGLEDALVRLHRAGHAITLVVFGEPSNVLSIPGFRIYDFGEEGSLEELGAFQMA